MISAAQILTFIGAAVVLKALYDVASFIWSFASPPAYHRYLYGKAPYALITGATDGIGKAVAKELYSKGFNLVIHGRNEEKLGKVQREIQAGGTRDVRLWLADANAPDPDFSKAVAQWEDIEITLLFNNVGGSPVRGVRMDQVSESDIMGDIRRNALFPLFLTRALLPKLRKASGPVQIVYVGSLAGELPVPTLVPYGATKAFVKQLTISSGADEKFLKPSNVSTMYMAVGSVVSGGHTIEPTLFSPTSEAYAKSVVARIGCGRRIVYPYVWHALQAWSVTLLPFGLLEKTSADGMEEELKALKKF